MTGEPLTINSKDFLKSFNAILRDRPPELVGPGLYKAANELLRDAIKVTPMAPFKEGHLRASARVDQVKVEANDISIRAGFMIKYAARWHELTPAQDKRINWSLKGSGRKYLELKMVMFKSKYMKIVAKHIENYLKSKSRR